MNALEVIESCKTIESIINRRSNLPVTQVSRRQDLNFSTLGHPKVQYKGVSRLSDIPLIMTHEQKRQTETPDKLGCTRIYCKDSDSSLFLGASNRRKVGPESQLHVFSCPTTRSEFKEDLWGLDTNPSLRGILLRLKKKYSLTRAEALTYYGKKDLFIKYLQGETSLNSYKKGVYKKTQSKEVLDREYVKSPIKKDFFNKFKYVFPRGYVVPK